MGSQLMLNGWQEKRPFQPQGVPETEFFSLLQVVGRNDVFQGCRSGTLQRPTREPPSTAAMLASTASLQRTLNDNPVDAGTFRLGPVSSWAALSVAGTNDVGARLGSGSQQWPAGKFQPVISGSHASTSKHSVEGIDPPQQHHQLQPVFGMRMSALRDPDFNARALLARHEQLQAQKQQQQQQQQQLLQLQHAAQQGLQPQLQQDNRLMLANTSAAALGTGPYPNQHSFARLEPQAMDVGGAVQQVPYNVGMDICAPPQSPPSATPAQTALAPVSWQPLRTPNLLSQTAPPTSARQHPAQQPQPRSIVQEPGTGGTADLDECMLAVHTGTPWPSNSSQAPMSPLVPMASPAPNPAAADCNNLGLSPAPILRKRLAIDGLIDDGRLAVTAPVVLPSLNNMGSGPMEPPLLLASRQVRPESWDEYSMRGLSSQSASFGSIPQQDVVPPVTAQPQQQQQPLQQQQQHHQQQQLQHEQEPNQGLPQHAEESGGTGTSGGTRQQGSMRTSGSSGASEGNQGTARMYDRQDSPRLDEGDEIDDGDEDDYDPDNDPEVVPGSGSRVRKKQASSPAGPGGARAAKWVAKAQGRSRGPRGTTAPRYRDRRKERLLELQARVAKHAEVISALQARLRQLEEEAGVLPGSEGPEGPPPGGVGPGLATAGGEGPNGTPQGGEGPGALGESMEIWD